MVAGKLSSEPAALLRGRFPIFKHTAYLNSCSYGALSDEVRAALLAYLDLRDDMGADWDFWCSLNDAYRASVAALIEADVSEVAVTTSLSAGLNSLASALEPRPPRTRILISDREFPTAAHIWRAQASRGFEIIQLPEGADGLVPLESYEQEVDERCALVSLSHICYRNGSLEDALAITELAHKAGALVFLDAFQSLGVTPLSVRELNVDFLAGGSLKYLLGTAGVAFLYVRGDWARHLRPRTSGWFAQQEPHAMDLRANTFADDARRFEAGTPPVPNLYAALAGLKIAREIGPARARAHVLRLGADILTWAESAGVAVATPKAVERRGPLLALRSHDAETLSKALSRRRVIVSARDGNLRISLHAYNNEQDLERLFELLEKHDELLVRR